MDKFVDKLPKVELHLHLEGAIPLPALFQLVKKYDGKRSIPNVITHLKRIEFSRIF